MNNNELLERAKHRRRLASMAMQRFAIKSELTPQEFKEAIDKVDSLTSMFGAPKDSSGKAVGKAGRTLALMEKWLDAKDKYGLPPVGQHYTRFVTRELDDGRYIWGHDEAARDLSRDIQYNFGFDPNDVVLVEQKEDEKSIPHFQLKRHEKTAPTEANMTTPPMVQPLQGPLNMNASVKNFTKHAQFAYETADVDDHTVLPGTPVVTRQDYSEDTEKARAASEFKKEPGWSANPRNTSKNDLLNDFDAKDYKREAPSTTLLEEKQFEDYSKKDSKNDTNRYPVRSFVAKPGIKQFAAKPGIKQFAGFHHTYTFFKNEDNPGVWFGPIKKVGNVGWDWECDWQKNPMPEVIAAALERRWPESKKSLNARIEIEEEEIEAFLDDADPTKINLIASKKK